MNAAKPQYTTPAGYATTQQVRQPAAVQKQPVSTTNFAYTSTTNPVGQTSYNTTTASTTYSGNRPQQHHQQLNSDPSWQTNLGTTIKNVYTRYTIMYVLSILLLIGAIHLYQK